MRVLVTRPQISAVRTAERLKAMGHEPLLLPLSQASHDPLAAVTALQEPHSALAVTSAEALRVLSLPEMRPILDPEKPLFAVGAATAAAARAAGFRHIHAGSGGGLELADLISSSWDGRSLPILYLAGKPRSPAFENRLDRNGIPLRVQEIYDMHPVRYDPAEILAKLAGHTADAVLFYSYENALRFFDLVGPDTDTLAGIRILCISERTAVAVPGAVRNNVVIAKSPDEDGLLALL